MPLPCFLNKVHKEGVQAAGNLTAPLDVDSSRESEETESVLRAYSDRLSPHLFFMSVLQLGLYATCSNFVTDHFTAPLEG